MTKFERLDQLRRGATVTRYHTHRVLRPQSVGEHSHGVALIALELWRETFWRKTYASELPPAWLLLAALEHDLAEGQVGDMPSPAKRRHPALHAALTNAELAESERLELGAHEHLGPEASDILRMADQLEFLCYALDERRLGNTDMGRVFARGALGIRKRLDALDHRPFQPAAMRLLEEIVDAMRREFRDEYITHVIALAGAEEDGH